MPRTRISSNWLGSDRLWVERNWFLINLDSGCVCDCSHWICESATQDDFAGSKIGFGDIHTWGRLEIGRTKGKQKFDLADQVSLQLWLNSFVEQTVNWAIHESVKPVNFYQSKIGFGEIHTWGRLEIGWTSEKQKFDLVDQVKLQLWLISFVEGHKTEFNL